MRDIPLCNIIAMKTIISKCGDEVNEAEPNAISSAAACTINL